MVRVDTLALFLTLKGKLSPLSIRYGFVIYVFYYVEIVFLGLGHNFFGYDNKDTSNESKNQHVGIHQIKELLHSKRSNQQNEKAPYGMGENICKPNI